MKKIILLLTMLSVSSVSHAVCNTEKVSGIYGFSVSSQIQGTGAFSLVGSLVLSPDGSLSTNYISSARGVTERIFARGDWGVRDNCTIFGSWFDNNSDDAFVLDGVAVDKGNTLLLGIAGNNPAASFEGRAERRNPVDQRL